MAVSIAKFQPRTPETINYTGGPSETSGDLRSCYQGYRGVNTPHCQGSHACTRYVLITKTLLAESRSLRTHILSAVNVGFDVITGTSSNPSFSISQGPTPRLASALFARERGGPLSIRV